jgi:polyhydroxybutyrate depolymerase
MMRALGCVLVLASLLVVGCRRPVASATPPKPPSAVAPKHGVFPDESLVVGGQRRAFRLVVPADLDLSKPVPLVVAFHGLGIDSKELMPKYTALPDTAAGKFVLVFPGAVGGSWGLSDEKVKADLAFFDALLADLKARYLIDSNRVYVLGMSNGGYFAHLVGKERSKSVAAVASHSGTLGLQTLLGVNAARKFPVLIIHGDRDDILKVEWARENRDKYAREGHEVKYVEVAGLGHLWASGQNVNDTIWRFFASHPLSN